MLNVQILYIKNKITQYVCLLLNDTDSTKGIMGMDMVMVSKWKKRDGIKKIFDFSFVGGANFDYAKKFTRYLIYETFFMY
jgi:hypothetical protein